MKTKENAAALAESSIFFPHSHPACLRRKIDEFRRVCASIHPSYTPGLRTGYLGRTASPCLATFEWISGGRRQRCLLQDREGWSFTFGPGRRCTFNALQSHQVDQLVRSGTVAGLFVNGTDLKSWCCPVTRRFSAHCSGEGATYVCRRDTQSEYAWWCGSASLSSAGLRNEAHGFDMMLLFNETFSRGLLASSSQE